MPKCGKVILLILEILQNYYSIEPNVGLETLRTIFRMLHEYLTFSCFNLYFVVVVVLMVFQGKQLC